MVLPIRIFPNVIFPHRLSLGSRCVRGGKGLHGGRVSVWYGVDFLVPVALIFMSRRSRVCLAVENVRRGRIEYVF